MAVVLGGNASGKSYSAAYKVAKFLRETPPPRVNTPFWIVSQTIEMASGNNWLKNLSQFITPDMIAEMVWYSKARLLPKAIILKPQENGNNWCIEMHSYDMDRKALQAYSLGGFHCDELTPYPILMELWIRCRDYGFPGSMLYTLTPIIDNSKGYSTAELEEIYKDRASYPDWKFYRLNASCNDKLAPGFIERFIKNEIEELRETRLTGAFCSLSGAVYKGFNDTDHVCKPFEIPRDWHHIRGVDFGWSHETAVVWAARSPQGKYAIYREYAAQKTLLRDHIEAIKQVAWNADDKQRYGEFFADTAGATERAEFADKGLPTRAAYKEVIPGIGVVQRLLRDKDLVIFDTCKGLLRQMRSYHWHPKVKDAVAKQDDDLNDALRYCLASDQRAIRHVQEETLSVQERIRRKEAQLMGD